MDQKALRIFFRSQNLRTSRRIFQQRKKETSSMYGIEMHGSANMNGSGMEIGSGRFLQFVIFERILFKWL